MSNPQRKPPKRKPPARPQATAAPEAGAAAQVKPPPAQPSPSAPALTPGLLATTGFFAGVGVMTAVYVGVRVLAAWGSLDDGGRTAAADQPVPFASTDLEPSPTPDLASRPLSAPGSPPYRGAAGGRGHGMAGEPVDAGPTVPEQDWEAFESEELPAAPPRAGPSAGSAAAPKDALRDIRTRNNHLPLPRRDFRLDGSVAQPVELATILVDCPRECELDILGSDRVFSDGRRFAVDCMGEDDGKRVWKVSVESADPYADERPLIGWFTLEGQSLQFQWDASQVMPSARPTCLRYGLLQVTVGDDSEQCTLCAAYEVPLPAIDWEQDPPSVPIPLGAESLPRAEYLLFGVKPVAFPPHQVVPGKFVKMGGTSCIRIYERRSTGGRQLPLLDANVFLELGENPQLELELFAYRPETAPGGSIRRVRQPITLRCLDTLTAGQDGRTKVQPEGKMKNLAREIAAAKVEMSKIEASVKKAQAARKRAENSLAKAYSRTQKKGARTELSRCQLILKRLADEKEDIEARFDALSKQLERYESERRFAEEEAQWRRTMADLFAKLRNEARIGYCIYADIGGRRIAIVQTEQN